jgi:Uncharacterised protein family (UPF0236)
VARRSVAGGAAARQLVLPGFEPLGPPPAAGRRGAGPVPAGADWEERCYVAGCAVARELAGALLAALEAWLHLTRPAGYRVVGWRGRTLVTRMGDLRVRRRLYRAGAGQPGFLLDAHLGWTPRQVATPVLGALLVDWATAMPFAEVARHLAGVTAGVVTLAGPTVRRQLRRVTERVRAAEVATHQAWTTTGQVPGPAGERVVSPLYVEADGVWVKTQREPAHRSGYELKCASAYEGWAPLAGPTAGHPRPHYALVAKQVYCHQHAAAVAPFWAGASLALHRTYDLSRLPLVVVGGDGANWIDTAVTVFPRVVRQPDGFHLARDAARGWGPEVGATLYAALRTGDRPTTAALLALPAPPRPAPVLALPAPPAAPGGPGVPAAPAALPAPAAGPPPRRATWTRRQVARARAAVTGQVGRPAGGADWRTRVAPEEVPPDARALGTQEGTNAHLLARRMKRRGMSWTVPGAQAMGKARELLTNGTLAPWCLVPGPPRPPPPQRLTGLPAAPRAWPQVACPAAHGPPHEAAVAHLQRILQGGYRLT